MAKEQASSARRGRGFSRASTLLQKQIGDAGKSRGFAVARLLTHWAEIVGEDIARVARPVKIGYGRDGFGAKLTILTNGAQAPLLQMQTERIREKVNACYGYAAISAIRITQTAPSGFAESNADFKRPHVQPDEALTAETASEARDIASDVTNDHLRAALEQLGQNIISKERSQKGEKHG